jgi:hypothetical protein
MFGKFKQQATVGKAAKATGVYVLTLLAVYASLRAGMAVIDLAGKCIGKVVLPKAAADTAANSSNA